TLVLQRGRSEGRRLSALQPFVSDGGCPKQKAHGRGKTVGIKRRTGAKKGMARRKLYLVH
ncbi:MAG: hypothetical protein J0H36_12900, partial [Hyphomicrobium denitrificans]|nr:hypothetical protein [Hyphomicrobium denitrificans]